MEKTSKIYIAGDTGLIGSSIKKKLKESGYKNLIFKTHKELDLTNQKEVEDFLKKEKPEYVFVCAGKIGGILANIQYPADFIFQNSIIATNLIYFSYKYKVKKLLYLGCSCIYPKNSPQPIKEEYLLKGEIEPTNEPYAIAKILGIKLCVSFNRQYKTNFIPAVAGNVYGPLLFHSDISYSHVIPSLFYKFHNAKQKGENKVVIWGTGKPKRDFLYVDDLADACIFLMERYDKNEIINIGTGLGTSISEISQYIKKITKFKGEIIYDTNKPDGMQERILDISKISSLGWKPKIDLEKGLELIYKHFPKL